VYKRQVIPDTQTVFFDVPQEYIGKEIEVIAFSKNDYLNTTPQSPKKVSFDALALNTLGFKFDRNEANER
jgi:hypothetical protein